LSALRAPPREYLAPFLTLLLLALLATVWVVSGHEERRREQAEGAIVAAQAALRLEDYVGARLLAADTLRRSLEAGLDRDRRSFEIHAQQIHDRFGGFLALNWIDGEGVIRWVVPLEQNRQALGRSPRDHPGARPTFLEAERTRADVATQPLTLFQGQRGFATYLPLDGPEQGTLNAVFDVRELVEDCYRAGLLDHWEVALQDDGSELYVTEDFAPSGHLVSQAEVRVLGRTWALSVHPRGMSPVPVLRTSFMAFGILLSIGLGVAVHVVMMRTREREEADAARVQLAQELAESKRLEALGQMAGGVAHDVNNLLTTISANASLLREGQQDAEDLELADDILAACGHGAEMTARLLAFSRQHVVQPVPLDTNRELVGVEKLLQRLLRDDIRWSMDVADDLWPIRMDPGEFSRALLNLGSNAVDAMPDGGALTLTARNADATPERPAGVELLVCDSGTGIPDDVRQRIFEPFFTTKGHGGGSGLGLASVKGAVHEAGGTIEVDDGPSGGARFTIWLPRTLEQPAALVSEEAAVSVDGGRTKLLLVDDQEPVRRVARLVLERAGYQVFDASTAEGARQIFREHDDIDVLVTDVVMPDIHGVELAAMLRADRPDLAVVFASGYAQQQLSPELLAEPGYRFVQKPFRAADLRSAVADVLEEVRTAGGSEARCRSC